MQNLDRWVAAYIAMDQRRRAESLIFMEDTARTYPNKKPAKLSLVANGAGGSGVSLNLSEAHDTLAPLSVCEIVKLK